MANYIVTIKDDEDRRVLTEAWNNDTNSHYGRPFGEDLGDGKVELTGEIIEFLSDFPDYRNGGIVEEDGKLVVGINGNGYVLTKATP